MTYVTHCRTCNAFTAGDPLCDCWPDGFGGPVTAWTFGWWWQTCVALVRFGATR